jgi:hypothetical protein
VSSPATAVEFAIAVPEVTHVKRVEGFGDIGRTERLVILGTGFSGRSKVKGKVAGVGISVHQDIAGRIVLKVATSAQVNKGVVTLTITLANGKSFEIHV